MTTQTQADMMNPDRRQLLGQAAMGAVAASMASLFPARPVKAAASGAIRPFHVNVPEEDLLDLRRRLATTRWPDREIVADQSQGVQLTTVQQLVRYWQTDYDWRKMEARLNALPQFVTEIDGVDIHFIHVRSRHENALPMIVTHGWPGSIIEQMKIVGPLTDPTAYGAKAADAFDLVIPSLPGHGFSGKPTDLGWDPQRVARVTEQMALLAPPELLGIHTNMPATVPDDIARALQPGGSKPSGLSADENNAYDQLDDFYKHGLGYAIEMSNRPQTLYGLVDSPSGLASWMLDHDARSAAMIARAFDGKTEGLSRDDVIDNVTLYWLTNTAVSSARLYWENKLVFFAPKHVKIPVAVSVFPDEIYAAPRNWAEKAYPKLIHYNRLDKGGHFAAWEQPALFCTEMRTAFRSLRQSI